MQRARKALLAATVTAGSLATFVVTADKAPAALPDASSNTIARVSMQIDGHEIAAFTRCIGLGSESEVVTSSQAGPTGEVIQRHLAKPKPARTVCERPLSGSTELASWRELVDYGDMAAAAKNVSVTMYNVTGAPTYRWHLSQTWPAELTNVFEAGIGREVVSFVHHGSQRVAP